VPGLPAHAAGVIAHAGGSLPVYDIRRRLGLPGVEQEARDLAASLAQRKQDHLRWLENLRGQVDRGERVSVQMDPHRCAFGKWYDTRVVTNYLVAQYLDRFDAPHQAVHQVAARADAALARGDLSAAQQLVREVESTALREVVDLFDGVADVLDKNVHPYVVVCESSAGERAGILVDELCELSPLHEVSGAVRWASGGACDGFTQAIGRLDHDGQQLDVLVLDVDRFLEGDPEA
jgi:purine-binding chemotaxis protein CheW